MSNHPVVDVSWYGATAFCNYYGYRLPTEWEWQAVADFDGSYTYGYGTMINQRRANYYIAYFYANPLNLSSRPYDPAPVCRIVNVTSNEPINDVGDGNTGMDWEITDDLTTRL